MLKYFSPESPISVTTFFPGPEALRNLDGGDQICTGRRSREERFLTREPARHSSFTKMSAQFSGTTLRSRTIDVFPIAWRMFMVSSNIRTTESV
ncbi:MAG TPA: hypothetical protein VGC73_04470 [Pyrinomonadaceae bacterium]